MCLFMNQLQRASIRSRSEAGGPRDVPARSGWNNERRVVDAQSSFGLSAVSQTPESFRGSGLERLRMLRLVPRDPAHSRAPVPVRFRTLIRYFCKVM